MSNQPTAADKRRWAKLVEYGCVCCQLDGRGWVNPQIHHVRIGSSYKIHSKTIPLCGRHHQYQFAVDGIPNREKNPKEFAATYGDDLELLAFVNGKIK